MIVIKIPPKVCSDYEGFSFLVKLINYCNKLYFNEIILDFEENTWFEANLTAVLGAILDKTRNNINNVKIINLTNRVEESLRKNNFLSSYGFDTMPDKHDTTIKYRRNKIEEDRLIKEFLDVELISKQDFPKLSAALRKEIIKSIFEIYSNAVIHGNCEFIYSCGQYYPSKTPPRLDFTIVDIGNTIKKNVNDFLKANQNGVDTILGTEAINWAVSGNNTTKPKENNIPGGLGLKLIKEFISLNKGKIQIVSADGYWEMSKDKKNETKSFEEEFPGTIVNIEFNLDDKDFYYLKSETIEDIIF